jgi:hypothetical protein
VDTDLFSRYSVIDVDSHLTEPPDVGDLIFGGVCHRFPDHPRPRTPAQRSRDYASETLGHLSDDALAKVLHDTAATLYRLP